MEIGVTVVGKIDLSQTESNDFYKTYCHFSQRLKERYQLHITKGQFRQLCSSPYQFIKYAASGYMEVAVEFKGSRIRAIRKNKGNNVFLLTALPK